MNTRSLKLLTTLAAALLASRAFAHEVDCEKTVGVVQVDRQGNPVLGQDGLPVFVGSTATSIVVDHYPAVVGFRVRVNNLATETSIIGSFSDPLIDASTSVVFGTVPSPGLGIPVGGSTDANILRRNGSFEECTGAMTPGVAAVLASLPPGQPLGGPVCRDGVVNVATVVTESNIAECRAKVICEPPSGPPPLPESCRTVNGVNWCYAPNQCGTGCAAVCAALGMGVLDATTWFEAQNTQVKCDAIASAFGATAEPIAGAVYACIEDGIGTHTAGVPLTGFLCSNLSTCPETHLLGNDQLGVPCDAPGSRMSICPCTPGVVQTIR